MLAVVVLVVVLDMSMQLELVVQVVVEMGEDLILLPQYQEHQQLSQLAAVVVEQVVLL